MNDANRNKPFSFSLACDCGLAECVCIEDALDAPDAEPFVSVTDAHLAIEDALDALDAKRAFDALPEDIQEYIGWGVSSGTLRVIS